MDDEERAGDIVMDELLTVTEMNNSIIEEGGQLAPAGTI